MNFGALKRIYPKNLITLFTLLCLFCSVHLPLKLIAETEIIVNNEDDRRARIACIIAGVTVVGLGVGIAFAASNNHHCHSSCYSSYYSCYSPCSSSYSSSCSSSSYSSSSSCSRSRHHKRRHSKNSCGNNGGIARNSIHAKQDLEGHFPHTRHKTENFQKSDETHQLAGQIYTHSTPFSVGHLSAFVHLPDGTTQMLGTIAPNGNSSLSFGPFDQTGNYTFGITVEDGSSLSSQTKIGTVNIEVNGSLTQSHDFIIPPHSPLNYEPSPFTYTVL